MNETIEVTKKINHGKNVKFARENWHEKRMSQEQLAEKMGKHQRDIHNWEYSETLDDEILYQLSAALDVPFEFLKYCPLRDEIQKWVYKHNEPHDNEISNTNNDNAKEQIITATDVRIEESDLGYKYAIQLGELRNQMKVLKAENVKLKNLQKKK